MARRIVVDVGGISFDERRAERRLPMTGRQVVVDHHAVTRLTQGLGSVAADVASATGDQDGGRLSCGQWSSR